MLDCIEAPADNYTPPPESKKWTISGEYGNKEITEHVLPLRGEHLTLLLKLRTDSRLSWEIGCYVVGVSVIPSGQPGETTGNESLFGGETDTGSEA